MKKGLLIYRVNKDDPSNNGVIRKCRAQQKAFEQNGVEVDMLWLCKKGVLKNESLVVETNLPPHSFKIYLFYFFKFGKLITQEVGNGNYDFIYLRHPFFDPLLVRSLRKLKLTFPKIKILLEINTFPYDSEPKRWLHKLSLKMDQYYRKEGDQFVDWIIHYGQREKIWNIPTINIRNGIDLEEIPLSKPKVDPHVLSLVAVGNWSYWHGLDRLLNGMKNYYQDGGRGVVLKIIGGGESIKATQVFIKENGLEHYVEFCPPSYGKDLDKHFAGMDIGIGTLGLHRKSVRLNSSLKHRSYCARGIPFILSGEDPDFPKHLGFVKYFEAKEEIISIAAIQSFLKIVIKENSNYQKEMRAYAEDQLSWKKKISKVVDRLD